MLGTNVVGQELRDQWSTVASSARGVLSQLSKLYP